MRVVKREIVTIETYISLPSIFHILLFHHEFIGKVKAQNQKNS